MKTSSAASTRMSNSAWSASDRRAMAAALALGRRGLGRTWPNPAVGCVILDSAGRIAGRGWTQPGGRPHAEVEALARAGDRALGGAAFVTLEPCSHHGATPPCADALIAAGVARVVAAIGDPDPRVAGRGFDRLTSAGVAVETGLLASAARFDQAGFLSRFERGRPMIALKTAMSLDGRIAVANGDSKWITGPEARRLGHRLRAAHDAILVGVGTALADDPRLDCRLEGLESASPLRVVLDSTLRLTLTHDLAAAARERPTWVICLEGADMARREALEHLGVRVLSAPDDGAGRVAPDAVAHMLAEAGVTRLLIEGGGAVAAAFLAADLVDRIHAFRAPVVIGGDGLPGIGALGLDRVAEAPRFILRDASWIDDDVAELYQRIEA